jgi:hypothetical protein
MGARRHGRCVNDFRAKAVPELNVKFELESAVPLCMGRDEERRSTTLLVIMGVAAALWVSVRVVKPGGVHHESKSAAALGASSSGHHPKGLPEEVDVTAKSYRTHSLSKK